MHKNRYWASALGLTVDLGMFVAALEYASGKSAAIMGKPSPYMFRLAIQSWNVPPDSVLVIGDDVEGDILGAKNVGMKSVLVKTGKFREDVLAQSKIKPDHIIESVASLPDLLGLS
jgi:ribonucleotide monophosphatase NagD (HAD superfamily)